MKKIMDMKWTLVVLFFVGLIIGTLIANLYIGKNLNEYDILLLDEYNIDTLGNRSSQEFFTYIVIKRIKQFAMLFLLSFTIFAPCVIFLLILSVSGLIGILLSLGTMRLGIQGVIITVCYFLPHYICYVFTFLFLIKRIKLSDRWFRFKKESTNHNIKIILSIVCILILLISGCFLESFINPILLKICYY